jgi:hypothetical protein
MLSFSFENYRVNVSIELLRYVLGNEPNPALIQRTIFTFQNDDSILGFFIGWHANVSMGLSQSVHHRRVALETDCQGMSRAENRASFDVISTNFKVGLEIQ